MELQLHVDSGSRGQSSKLADELLRTLNERFPLIGFERRRHHDSDMDLGSIIVAVLSAKSVVELAKGPVLELSKGISQWLEKRRATISIGADGSILASNVRPEDVLPLLEKIISSRD